MEYIPILHKDKRLKKATAHLSVPELKQEKRLYLELCASVISQQLSTVVATVIHKRFLNLFPGPHPTPEAILQVPAETLRSIGLSASKAAYIHNICAFFVAHELNDRKLYRMSDEELIELLSQIKGIGRWSVEMLLIFAMGRPDVFAMDDLGIQKAVATLYGLDEQDKKGFKKQMLEISAQWKPFRSYACLLLWAWYNESKVRLKSAGK